MPNDNVLTAEAQPAQADAPAEAREPHSDDVAVDSFAAAMKHKLALARAKGRGGWETCSPADLSRMLREHVEKGDPRDVANFCMMMWHHGSPIVSAPADSGEARLTDEPSLTNPLTPYGMLVRALRIVSGTTLMDMAKALLTTPAKLSAMEFGRAPVTPEFAFDVAAYFDALGVPCTEYALRAAARAQGGKS
ncbi:helix-turn-helix domain-containing protein [Burkholderia multivorans]|nr:helix-turn-helix domain-containing protein [Burkholderia multivorans]